MSRQLVVTAYDIQNPRRLAAARAQVSEWAHGGQKSVWECLAMRTDRRIIGAAMFRQIDPAQDRLSLLLPNAGGILGLGRAEISRDAPLVFVG